MRKSNQKKIILIVVPVISAFLVLSYLSLPSNASIIGGTGSFSGCAGGGVAGAYLSDILTRKINDGLQGIARRIPKLAGFLNPLSIAEVPVGEGFQRSKESIGDVLTRCAAREILSKMSRDITNVARTGGRNGGPSFVRDWRNFQTDAQYRGERVFRAVLSNTKLCDHFDQDIKGLFGVKKKTPLRDQNTRIGDFDSFQLRAGCTLPSGFKIDEYKKDFGGNGGWEAWSRLLEPQNNFYGALFQSLDEADRQRSLEESADINEVTANDGFTGKRGDNQGECAQYDDAGKCNVYKKIKTPGKVISNAVAATFQQELAWVANTDELSELIATAVEVLINRVTDFSNPNEGEYIIPGDVDFDDSTLPQEPPTSGPSPGPGGGGSGVCTNTGTGVANYAGALQSAINSVISENPSGIADELNTTQNSFTFLNFVADKLKTSGYNATTNVLNGNGNPNSGDLIAVWRSGDMVVERYDAISGVGDADKPMRTAGASADFKGDIPLSCASGSGTAPPTAQEYQLSHSYVGEKDVVILAEVGNGRTFDTHTGEKIDIYVNDSLKQTCSYTPCIYSSTYADGQYTYKGIYARTNGERLYMAPKSFTVPASAPQPGPIASADGTLKAAVSGTAVTLEYTTNSRITFAYIERGGSTASSGWISIAQLQGDNLRSGTVTDNPPLSSFGQTNHTYRLMTIGDENNDIELARVTVLIISE